MTVYEGQPTLSVDPEASLRAELTGAIAAAQFDIESAIAEVMRSGADVSALANQAQSLQQLQKQIGSAGATTLISLRAEIAGAVATTQAVTQQARTVAATAAQAAAEALGAASANSRASVNAIMRDMHRFDPYLQFASAEDEAEYRKREAERRAYIDAQHAKGTPEGNLNAAGAAIGQMADAKAHGAGNSPEFERWSNELTNTTTKLRDAARQSGLSTEEFDRNISADYRRISKAQGLSDAEINARLATHDGDALKAIAAPNATPTSPAPEASPPVDDLADAMAAFKAAGIKPDTPEALSTIAHRSNAGNAASQGATRSITVRATSTPASGKLSAFSGNRRHRQSCGVTPIADRPRNQRQYRLGQCPIRRPCGRAHHMRGASRL